MIIEHGDRGIAVIEIQKLLGIKQDGIFGNDTENAVKEFQRKNNLTTDGIVGPRTMSILKNKPRPILGIDIYNGTGIIDFDQVKNKYSFVIIKCSEGVTYTDPKFSKNIQSADKNGLLVGAYHYARPDNNSPELESRVFFDRILKCGVDLSKIKMCLDLENKGDWNTGNLQEWAYKFLENLEKLSGKKPVFYTFSSYLSWLFSKKNVSNFNVLLLKYPLWIAHYTTDDFPKIKPYCDYSIWQYSSRGDVPGIVVDCDLNRFNGTKEELEKFWKE